MQSTELHLQSDNIVASLGLVRPMWHRGKIRSAEKALTLILKLKYIFKSYFLILCKTCTLNMLLLC